MVLLPSNALIGLLAIIIFIISPLAIWRRIAPLLPLPAFEFVWLNRCRLFVLKFVYSHNCAIVFTSAQSQRGAQPPSFFLPAAIQFFVCAVLGLLAHNKMIIEINIVRAFGRQLTAHSCASPARKKTPITVRDDLERHAGKLVLRNCRAICGMDDTARRVCATKCGRTIQKR